MKSSRIRFLCFVLAAPVWAQGLSYGIKLGTTPTDPVRNGASGSATVGAEAELRLPFRLGVEFDILRRPLAYTAADATNVTGSVWQFPLLAKYRFRPGLVTPFAGLGVAWNRVTAGGARELARSSVSGTPVAAGLEGCFGPFCLSGEIRYTRWHDDNFALGSTSLSNRNQFQFLVGITL